MRWCRRVQKNQYKNGAREIFSGNDVSAGWKRAKSFEFVWNNQRELQYKDSTMWFYQIVAKLTQTFHIGSHTINHEILIGPDENTN